MEMLRFLRRRREMRLEELRRRQISIHRGILRDTRAQVDPFAFTEEVFCSKYRLSKDLARVLIQQLMPFMPTTERRHALLVQQKVLCALYFYAHGSYQKPTGSEGGFSQSSVSRAISEVTDALNTAGVLTQHIKFPETREEKREAIQRNFDIFGLPGVVGYVDGTHIAIVAPHEEPEIYMNRKRFYSLNVQIICDADLSILNVTSRYPGSTHDAYIWRVCSVRQTMLDWHRTNEPCWLLGDSGYPLEPWLLTPVLDAGPDTPELFYTRTHCSARNTVERCIGVLKSRFRCLLRQRTLAYEPRKCALMVNACSVLHNLCIRGHVPAPRDAPIEEEVPAALHIPEPRRGRRREDIHAEGQRVRDEVIRRLQA